jgi:hypothetical protein
LQMFSASPAQRVSSLLWPVQDMGIQIWTYRGAQQPRQQHERMHANMASMNLQNPHHGERVTTWMDAYMHDVSKIYMYWTWLPVYGNTGQVFFLQS